jgi:hypothetical protein
MNLRTSSTLVLTALACAVVGHAQTSQTTGAIRGQVRSKKGGPIADVSITARNLDTGFSRKVATDKTGSFVMSLLPVGPYEVTAAAPGLKTLKNPNLRISLAETASQLFTMDVEQSGAEVVVVAEASQVDTANVNTITTFSQEVAESVPLSTRNFTDLVQLTPGAPPNAQGYRTSVEGARGVMNNLMIDGVSYNSKFNGEQRGGTRIPFAFGLDSIGELQVITNPFDVQYGDASGGVVNAITKSGTNEFSGSVFTQIRPNSLVANMKPVPSDPYGTTNNPAALTRTFSRSEYGFNLGGPIIKDKLHYFVNVDYVHFSQDSLPKVSLGSTDGTLLAFNTFWGAGGMGQTVSAANNGRSLYQESMNSWTDDEKHLTLMGRLDWAINESHRAALRMNVQDYKGLNDIYAGSIKNNIAESNNSRIKYQTLSWVASLNSVLSNDLVNDAYIQVSTEHRPETPNSTVSPEIGLPGFTAGNYYIDPRNTDETTTQVVDNLTYMTGNWLIKTGIDWQFLNYRNTFFQYGHGAWYFKNWDAANQWFAAVPGTPLSNPATIQYQQAWSNTNGVVNFGEKLLATYLSAEYQGFLDKRLTLTFGVRYTREMYDANANPNPRVQGLDQMPDNGAADPRIGFAYDLFGNKRTVLRGGYGLFSVSNPAQNVASAFLQNGQNTLPYKVSWSAANDAVFTSGLLSYKNLVDPATGHLQALDPSLLSSLPAGSIQLTLMDPRARMSQSRNILLGIEHEMDNGLILKARGVYKRFSHLQYFVDINMSQSNPATGSYDPSLYYNDGYPYQYNHFNNSSSSSIPRPGRAIVDGRMLDLSGYGSVGLSRWDGEGSYKALILEAERRVPNGFGFYGNLTLSSSRDSNSNERGTAQSASSNPNDPSNPLVQSRSDNDIPFRVNFISYFPPFFGIRTSSTLVYSSGYAYTPRHYADSNSDGYLNDPALDGRNSERQPNIKRFDLQFKRSWRLASGVKLDGAIQIYNAFNWANQSTSNTSWDTSSGTQNPYFGLINVPDKSTREVQFSLKAKF